MYVDKKLESDARCLMCGVDIVGEGGAVYLNIGGADGSTSNTAVALTNCTITNNTASGSC